MSERFTKLLLLLPFVYLAGSAIGMSDSIALLKPAELQTARGGGDCPNLACLGINCVVNQADNNQCGFGGVNGQTCKLDTDSDKCVAVTLGKNAGSRCLKRSRGQTCSETSAGGGCAKITTGDPVDGKCTCDHDSGTCGSSIYSCTASDCPKKS